MREFDAAIGQASDGGSVGDHEDGMALAMQIAEELDDGLLICFV